ncbi:MULTISPECIES: hypothetical protein [Micromonospora]|uniref:hypothetical protein n=1 Tax=Micromonospora TaxID=1873 RepID=UPI001374CEAF|nr:MULTISPECIES: hypothetical protein [unclassified Micromonospora]MBM0229289.1 hypothetical protein [Micromonospora sp. ATA51]
MQFDRRLAEAVSRVDVDNKGLTAMRTRLIELQTEKAKLCVSLTLATAPSSSKS